MNPTVGMLRSIEGFEFSSSTVSSASLSSIELRAICSSFIGEIEMNINGTDWITPTSYDPAAPSTCVNGSFSVTLSNSKEPWKSLTVSPGQSLSVQFRGKSTIGNWVYRVVNIVFSPSVQNSQEVLAGVQSQSGGGLLLHGRLRSQKQHVASGGSFKIKGIILR